MQCSKNSKMRNCYAQVSIPQAVWIACNVRVHFQFDKHMLFQYRKRYGLHATGTHEVRNAFGHLFQYRKRYGLHATLPPVPSRAHVHQFQYRKRYGLHATCKVKVQKDALFQFQYRKRYGLHATLRLRSALQRQQCFNTASGMDCMQRYGVIRLSELITIVSIPQAVWIACNLISASWMEKLTRVSIPQAVWIACN